MKLEYFQGSFFTAREEFSKSKKIPQVMYFSAKAVALYVCQSLESLCAVVINVAGACFFKQCKLKDAIAPSFVFIGKICVVK